MLYIIFLTGRCNLKCRYCGGTIPDYVMPRDVRYSIRDLEEFISQDENPSIAFYGGEPLLRIDLIKRIMDEIDAEHYILQTNGLLLDRLDPDYLKRLSSILVSIDGRKEVTDFYRGNGVYDRVLRNVRRIKDFFDGELIARMTISRKSDVCTDVKHIISLNIFTHIHWQLDVIWNEKWKGFEKWLHEYNTGISKLVDMWVSEIERGNLIKIVPFLGVFKAILGFKNTSPPCGSGVNSFAISTDGRVLACPICADFEWNVLGNINSDLESLKRVEIIEPCKSCKYLDICGGRCLFFNRERLWGDQGFRIVCNSVRHLIEKLKSVRDRVLKAIRRGLLDFDELIYPKFNNTTEIIP